MPRHPRRLAVPSVLALLLLPLALGGSRFQTGTVTDPARMLNTIRDFSEFPDGSPRSRYCYRTEMDALQNDLAARLGEALGARGSAFLWSFPTKHGPDDWDTTGVTPARTVFRNVVGTLPGNQPGRGRILITSHFDATGLRTTDWRPWADPAPGADDNMSGTAAVLDLARVLAADPVYPFDIEFVCFDGEELGLWGSEAYADSAAADPSSTPILAVLNMDMIGYDPDQDSLVVMSNRSSKFLADFMVESELESDHDPSFKIASSVNNLFISDQAPFWDHGIPGVLMIENIRVVLSNPQYHQVTDRLATISRGGEMAAKIANVILKTVRGLAAGADGPPNVVTSENDVYYAVNRVVEARYAVPGDSLRITAGFLNLGGPTDNPGTASFYRVRDGVREFLFDEPIPGPLPTGAHAVLSRDFTVQPDEVGAVTYVVETGSGAAATRGRAVVPVAGNATRVVHHYMAPNPVRDVGAAHLDWELSGEATVRVSILDMHGHGMGTETFLYSGIPSQPGPFSGIGLQSMPLSRLLDPNAAPGIYLYRIEIFPDGTGAADVTTGKFAILR